MKRAVGQPDRTDTLSIPFAPSVLKLRSCGTSLLAPPVLELRPKGPSSFEDLLSS